MSVSDSSDDELESATIPLVVKSRPPPSRVLDRSGPDRKSLGIYNIKKLNRNRKLKFMSWFHWLVAQKTYKVFYSCL